MEEKYTISKVASIFGITTNKIRFYEKKGLISPVHDDDSGYRYYEKNDILKLQSILLYRSIGIPLEEISNILNSSDRINYLNHFNNQWTIINDEISRLTSIRASLEGILDKLYDSTSESITDNSLLNEIMHFNEINKIKNNWHDRWNFNSWASTYDADVKRDPGSLKIYKNYTEILRKVYEKTVALKIKKPSILEIGVGTGNLAGQFLNMDCKITGIDQSREMLMEAKKKFPSLKVRLGEFLKIPMADNSIDVIISTYAFHHLNSKEKTIAVTEMLRVLKKNGHIIIGDLMFESEEKKQQLFKTLSNDEIAAIEDEYYSDVSLLKEEFTKHNRTLKYEQIDRLNFIIQVY